MTQQTIVLHHDPKRARKQAVAFAVGAVVGLAFLVGGVWLLISGLSSDDVDGLGIVIAIVVGALGLVTVIVAGVVAIASARTAAGPPEPAFSVDATGFALVHGVTVLWDEIVAIHAIIDRSISFAHGANAGMERAVEGAMRRGGVGDGVREIELHVRDAAAVKARLGPRLDFMVDTSTGPGTGVVRSKLDSIVDQATFEAILSPLAAAAAARHLPFEVVDKRS